MDGFEKNISYGGFKISKTIYKIFDTGEKNPPVGKPFWLENKQMIRGNFEVWLQGTRENKGLFLKESRSINTMEQYYLTIKEIKAAWEQFYSEVTYKFVWYNSKGYRKTIDFTG